jgi:hypothetical protein
MGVPVHVSANAQKTAFSMGIGMVDEEERGSEIVFWCARRRSWYSSTYHLRENEKNDRDRSDRFSRNSLCYKNKQDYHKKGQRHASVLYLKER